MRKNYVKTAALLLTMVIGMTGFGSISANAAETQQTTEEATQPATEVVTQQQTETADEKETVPATEVETGAASEAVRETEVKTEKTEKSRIQSRAALRAAVGNLDIVNGQAVRMAKTNTGVVVDGHQLNHDYVKILNINNGEITIRDENYTQGAENGAWSTQEDAYVIKGKGTSTNNITITPTKNEITIYLVDLEWNGFIKINGSPCNVNIVACGNVKNENTSYFIALEGIVESFTVRGLSGREDTITSKTFNYYNVTNYSGTLSRRLNVSDITINTDNFLVTGYNTYYEGILSFNNAVLNNKNTNNINYYGYTTVNATNSMIRSIDFITKELSSTDSVVHFKFPFNGKVNARNSNLSLNSGTASVFNKITMINSSLYAAVKFTGTPVDDNTNDLYLKKIRLRQFPNTFVYITINGQEARLQTDANGYLYPYVKLGTTRVDARLEDGRTYYATFPATSGADETTTNLIQSSESIPVIVSCSGTQQVTVGAALSLFVEANPGTTGKALSYQWFKNDQPIAGATQAAYVRNEATTNDSGLYKCAVKEDGGGTATSDLIDVVVSKEKLPNTPVIVSVSSDLDLIAGSSVKIMVNAAPSVATNALSYQWFRNGNPVGTDSNQFSLTNVKVEEQGSYKCVITEENSNTTTESGMIKITVR